MNDEETAKRIEELLYAIALLNEVSHISSLGKLVSIILSRSLAEK